MSFIAPLPTDSVTIELPWPPKELSPNYRSRSHWPRTNALRKAGGWAFNATLEALGPAHNHTGLRLPFSITAHPPTKRRMDDDNLVAACKAYRDGIAHAIGCDDSLFDLQPIKWGEPTKGGKLIVVVG